MPRKYIPKEPRRIEEKRKGRVYWQPGEEHPLDILRDDLQQLKDQLPDLLHQLLATAQQTVTRLEEILSATGEGDDFIDSFSQGDRAVRLEIVNRFSDRKHLEHLLLAFSTQRHKRLLGRLQTIQAALTLANDLLAAEETLSQEFLATGTQSQEQEEEPLPKPKHSAPTNLTRGELRMRGLDEPLTPIVSSVDQARQILRNFEAHLPDLRRQLATGQGWFEVFFVPKRHYKAAVIAYDEALEALRKHKTPIPPEIESAIHPEVARLIRAGVTKHTDFPKELRLEVFDIVKVGPYAKYRWTEGKQTYTISLGLLDDYPPFPFVPEGF
jgi:hypothetical protein